MAYASHSRLLCSFLEFVSFDMQDRETMRFTYSLSPLHCSEQYLMPKHFSQATVGAPVSLKSFPQTAQHSCTAKYRSLKLHDALCDMLQVKSVDLLFIMGCDDKVLTYKSAASHLPPQ